MHIYPPCHQTSRNPPLSRSGGARTPGAIDGWLGWPTGPQHDPSARMARVPLLVVSLENPILEGASGGFESETAANQARSVLYADCACN